MTTLITGGCGFLGSNLSAAALDKGLDLVIFDNLSRLGSEQNLKWLQSLGKKFTFVNGDIRSAQINKVIQQYKPETIFHLAGQVTMTLSIENPRHDFERIPWARSIYWKPCVRMHPTPQSFIPLPIKCTVTWNNLNIEKKHCVMKLFRIPRGLDENLSLEFCSPYGCSKGSADQYMLDYARIFGLNTVVFRHSTMFGVRQFSNYDQGWIGWFVGQALIKVKNPDVEPFTVSGNGKQVRDILFSEDIVRCYFAAVEHIAACRGQVFNIGGGYANSMSLLELLNFLESKLDVKLNFRPIPWRQSDQKVFIADIRKAQKHLHWNPTITKHEGVSRMIDWVREHV